MSEPETAFEMYCPKCAAEYERTESACTADGTKLCKRFYHSAVATSTLRTKTTLKAKAADAKKPFLESIQGDNFHRDDSTWAKIEQIVDRRNKRYWKKVTHEDGRVIKDVNGPLSDQSLHGTPKKIGE